MEYRGLWNDKDNRWTPEIKAQVPYANEDDGVFFVEDKDFVKAFEAFTISYYSKDKHSSHYEVLNDNGKTREFTFELPIEQEAFIGISFYNRRMYPEMCRKSMTTSQFTLILPDGSEETMQTIEYEPFNQLHSMTFPKGKYTVKV